MKRPFFRGLCHGIPICLGYLAVSFGFGIFAVKAGLSILETVLISMTNLTSAGQLAGVPILTAGGSLWELALTESVINLRYALMSVSLSQKLDGRVRLPQRLLIAFGNTDDVLGCPSSLFGLGDKLLSGDFALGASFGGGITFVDITANAANKLHFLFLLLIRFCFFDFSCWIFPVGTGDSAL